jgi:alanyl-tRNA synthetase
MSKDGAASAHGSYVERVREDTQRYAAELLKENERLRLTVVALQQESSELRDEAQRAKDELAQISARETKLREALDRVEEENRRFSSRYVEVEQENSNLANLYVASYRLHGTVDREEVLAVIQEIAANLIGSEEMAVFEMSPDAAALQLVASFGVDPAPYHRVALSQGLIGRAAASGETYVAGEQPLAEGVACERDLTACIPLKLGGRVTGAIALFRLLPQKSGIETLDRELFDLLATHAATALYCSSLMTRASAPFGR